MSLDHSNTAPFLQSSKNPYSSAHFLPGIKRSKRHTSLRSHGQKLFSTRYLHGEVLAVALNEVPDIVHSKQPLSSVRGTVRNSNSLATISAAEESEHIPDETNLGSCVLGQEVVKQKDTNNSICAIQAITSTDIAEVFGNQSKETQENVDSTQETTESIFPGPGNASPQQEDSNIRVYDTTRDGLRLQSRATSSLSNTTSLASTAGYNGDTEVHSSSTYSRTSEESFKEYRQYINNLVTSRIVKDIPALSLLPDTTLSINSLYHEFIRGLADPVAEHETSCQSTPHTLIGDANALSWGGSSLVKHDLITVPEFTIDPNDLQLPAQAVYPKEQDMPASFSARIKAYHIREDTGSRAILEPTFTEDWIFDLDEQAHPYKQYDPHEFEILKGGCGLLPDDRDVYRRSLGPLSTSGPALSGVTPHDPCLAGQDKATIYSRTSRTASRESTCSISSGSDNRQPSTPTTTVKQPLPILTISPPKSPQMSIIHTFGADMTTEEQYKAKKRQTYSLSSIPELAMLSLAFCNLPETPVIEPTCIGKPDLENRHASSISFQRQPSVPTAYYADLTESPQSTDDRHQANSSMPIQLASQHEEKLSQTNLITTHDLSPELSIFPELDLNPSLNLDPNLSLADFLPRRSPSAPPSLNSPTLSHKSTRQSRSTLDPQSVIYPLKRSLTISSTPPSKHTEPGTPPDTPLSQETTPSISAQLRSLLHDSCPFPAPVQRSRHVPQPVHTASWLKPRLSPTDLDSVAEMALSNRGQSPAQSPEQFHDQDQAHGLRIGVSGRTRNSTRISTRTGSGKASPEIPTAFATTAATTATADTLDLLTGNTATTHSWTEVWAGQGDLYGHLAPASADNRDRDRDRHGEYRDASTGWKDRQRQRVRGMLRGVLRRV